jgi:hypothetical protein
LLNQPVRYMRNQKASLPIMGPLFVPAILVLKRSNSGRRDLSYSEENAAATVKNASRLEMEPGRIGMGPCHQSTTRARGLNNMGDVLDFLFKRLDSIPWVHCPLWAAVGKG